MVGMRTLKTSLAIFVALIVSDIFKLQYPFFTVIAIIVVMQNTINETYQMGINRILGTALGGLAGILYIGFIASDYWILDRIMIGVITLFIILILIKMKATKAISISLIVFLSICINDIKRGSGVLCFSEDDRHDGRHNNHSCYQCLCRTSGSCKKFADLLKRILSEEKSIFIKKLSHNEEIDLSLLSKSLDAARETLKKYHHDSKWVPYNEEGLIRKEEFTVYPPLFVGDLSSLGYYGRSEPKRKLGEETLSRLSSFDNSTYQRIYEEYFRRGDEGHLQLSCI